MAAEHGWRWTGLAIATIVTVALPLVWKLSLPNNQHRDLDTFGPPPPGRQLAQVTAGYDDVVTIVTAHNFARDGFLRTHFLPNRKFAPLVSYFDHDQSQCLTLAPPAHPVRYANFWGAVVDQLSLDSDCIYTHYPPLADWVFGAMASMGLDQVLHYKLFALLVNCLFLLLFFRWLAGEVRPAAAYGALLFLALSPAFFEWAGALFHQSFQYLFLAGGLVAVRAWVARGQRRWWAATWALFFCEALVSPELVIFFGLVVGHAVLTTCRRPWRSRLAAVLLLGSAPVAAFLLHQGLRISLFGVAAVVGDIRATVLGRMAGATGGWGVGIWFERIHFNLLPPVLMAACLLACWLAARLDGRVPGRRLGLLAVFLAGGVSFAAAFPATASVHSWMMYRHLLPFVTLLVAFALDAALRAVESVSRWRTTSRARVALAGVVLGLVALPVSWAGARSLNAIRAEVAWGREVAEHDDPRNQAVQFLDVLSWSEQGPLPYDLGLLHAVDGRRRSRPDEVVGVLLPESHFDVWWLEQRTFVETALATDVDGARRLIEHCRLEVFDGGVFVPAACTGTPRMDADPIPGLAWVRYPCRGSGRALQLSCGAAGAPIPIHELEVF